MKIQAMHIKLLLEMAELAELMSNLACTKVLEIIHGWAKAKGMLHILHPLQSLPSAMALILSPRSMPSEEEVYPLHLPTHMLTPIQIGGKEAKEAPLQVEEAWKQGHPQPTNSLPPIRESFAKNVALWAQTPAHALSFDSLGCMFMLCHHTLLLHHWCRFNSLQ